MDFLLVLIELFSLGVTAEGLSPVFAAMSENRLKIGVSEEKGQYMAQNFRYKVSSPTTILTVGNLDELCFIWYLRM